MIELPDHILATYLEYKRNEREFLLWITNTNQAIKDLSQAKQTQGSGKTKSAKQKKNHKTKADLTESTRSIVQEPEDVISLFDVLLPAQAIAVSNVPSQVPREIARALHKVLALRKRCTAWYKQNTAPTDLETRRRNKQHEYPINLLEKVRSILSHKLADDPDREIIQPMIGPNNKKIQGSSFSCSDDLTVLERPSLTSKDIINDTIQSFEEQKLDANPGPYPIVMGDSRTPALSVSPDSIDDQEARIQDEFMLARFCLLEDIQQIEDFAILELARFALDQDNANTLPFVMNAAVDIVMSTEKEFKKQFPDFVERQRAFWDTTLHDDASLVKLAPLFRMQALISSHARLNLNVEDVSSKMGSGCFNPRDPYFGSSNEQQWVMEVRFWCDAQSTYSSMDAIEQETDRVYSRDLLHRIMRETARISRNEDCAATYLSIGFTFAIRLALLTAIICRDLEEAVFDHLAAAVKFSQTVEPAFKKFWTTKGQQSPQHEFHYWREHDEVHRIRHNDNMKYDEVLDTVLRSSPRFDTSLYTMNSALIRAEYASSCIKIMEIDQTVQPLAHLFNLLKQQGRLKHDWPDLTVLQDALSEKYFFQDKRPILNRFSDVDNLYKPMLWSIGVRSKDLDLSISDDFGADEWNVKKIHKTFKNNQFPLFAVLAERPARKLLDCSFAEECLEFIVGATVIPRVLGLAEMPLHMSRTKAGGHLSLLNRGEVRKKVDSRSRLQPVHLLAAVKVQLEREFKILDFDYLSFQKACSELMERLFQCAYAGRADELVTSSSEKAFAVITVFAHGGLRDLKSRYYAQPFNEWLSKNAEAGTQHRSRKRPPTRYPLRLPPSVVEHVRRIVQQRGLLSATFEPDQLYGMGIHVEATQSFESMIREKYDSKRKRAQRRR